MVRGGRHGIPGAKEGQVILKNCPLVFDRINRMHRMCPVDPVFLPLLPNQNKSPLRVILRKSDI